MIRERLSDALGAGSVLYAPEDLAVYRFDGYATGATPGVVVLPQNTREVCAVMKIARDCGVPVVARGAGTGLCGGATPGPDAVVISFARMNRILELDVAHQRVRVQPGLVNLELSTNVAHNQLFYAPDPASQRSCTIGGNIGTNAGGPHCLAYGTTTSHVLGLEVVDEFGDIFHTHIDDIGYDLTGALVGGEGTLGLVTSAWLRLTRTPPAVRVWLASFNDIESASETVSAIIRSGIVPTALEMMDATIIAAVEAVYHAGYPTNAAAVLLIENAGFEEDMQQCEADLARICRDHSALSWRVATSQQERDALWLGRKSAAGAIGSLSPNYYIQDVTVPRSKLPQALRAVEHAVHANGLRVGNVFHAGDGNLHPLIMYDKRNAREVAAVVDAGTEILTTAIALGGTISGEHGIGSEKRETLGLVYSEDDLDPMLRLRNVFNASGYLNPEKIFPRGARCAEVQ